MDELTLYGAQGAEVVFALGFLLFEIRLEVGVLLAGDECSVEQHPAQIAVPAL